MVDAMPVPDAHQKVDELFLFWLSEPSTQEMLRKELTKVCRYGNDLTSEGGDSFLGNLVQPTVTNIQRPISPTYRTPSPPLHLSNSPKSPRAKRRARSPRRNLKSGLGGSHAAGSGKIDSAAAFDDIDYFPSASSSPPSFKPESRTTENGPPGEGGGLGENYEKVKSKRVPEDGGLLAQVHVVATGEEECSSASAKLSRPTEVIPQFFFPNGRLGAAKEGVDEQLKEAARVFQEQPNGEITQSDFHLVVKVITQVKCSHFKVL